MQLPKKTNLLIKRNSKVFTGSIDTTGTVIEDDRFYNKDVVGRRNHDPPHFGIRTDKLKFVPDKLAVMSVAQLELAGVPTPIFLPFGFSHLPRGEVLGSFSHPLITKMTKGFSSKI